MAYFTSLMGYLHPAREALEFVTVHKLSLIPQAHLGQKGN